MRTPIWNEMAEELHARLDNLRKSWEALPPVVGTPEFRAECEKEAISDYLQQRLEGAETVPFPVGVSFDDSDFAFLGLRPQANKSGFDVAPGSPGVEKIVQR